MRSQPSTILAAVLGLFVACITPVNVHAQYQSDFSQLEKTLKQNDQLTLTTDSGTKIKGKLIQASPDQILLNLKRGAQQIPASRILKVQRTRNGVLLGAVIGAGAGILPAIALSAYAHNEGGDSAIALAPIGLGAAVGIGIDALLSTKKTMYERKPNQRLTLRPVLDRNRLGAPSGLAVLGYLLLLTSCKDSQWLEALWMEGRELK